MDNSILLNIEGITRRAETKYASMNEFPISAAAKPGIINNPPLMVEPVAIAKTSKSFNCFFKDFVLILAISH